MLLDKDWYTFIRFYFFFNCFIDNSYENKIFIRNITVTYGYRATLECPILVNNQHNKHSSDQLPRLYNGYDNVRVEHDDDIKAVLWTYEKGLKLIATNNRLFVKNIKYSLAKSKELVFFFNSTQLVLQTYHLRICPVDFTDSGWYSCHIIKNSNESQNVKYLMYLNIIQNKNNFDQIDCKSLQKIPQITNSSLYKHDKYVYSDLDTTTSYKHLEDLYIVPKHINISEYRSIHFECVYHGPYYDQITLEWFKNGQKIDTSKSNKRLFMINLKQNGTLSSILKFSYSLFNDSGNFECRAKGRQQILMDSSKLNIYEEDLYDSERRRKLIESYNNMNEDLVNESSSLYEFNCLVLLFLIFLLKILINT